MNYNTLRSTFLKQQYFSVQQIRLIENDFRLWNLHERKKQWYLRQITKWWYIFSEAYVDETILCSIANHIYSPSYISMEFALRHYNLIPEGVFMKTSITTKKSQILSWDLGSFKYNSIKPSLFWGYHLEKNNLWKQYLLADIEKAICDFLYLKNHYNNEAELHEWRIDTDELHEQIDRKKLIEYALRFKSRALLKRVQLFISYFKSHA